MKLHTQQTATLHCEGADLGVWHEALAAGIMPLCSGPIVRADRTAGEAKARALAAALAFGWRSFDVAADRTTPTRRPSTQLRKRAFGLCARCAKRWEIGMDRFDLMLALLDVGRLDAAACVATRIEHDEGMMVNIDDDARALVRRVRNGTVKPIDLDHARWIVLDLRSRLTGQEVDRG